MLCFTRFINNTTSSAISILVDDSRIFTDVLSDNATPYIALNVGTRKISVLKNNEKLLLNKNISLPPINYAIIILNNDSITILPE